MDLKIDFQISTQYKLFFVLLIMYCSVKERVELYIMTYHTMNLVLEYHGGLAPGQLIKSY